MKSLYILVIVLLGISITPVSYARDAINIVEDYGAVMDGRDNTQAFVNACRLLNTDIIIPPGTAKITQRIAVGSGSSIIGSGTASTVLDFVSTANDAGFSGANFDITDVTLFRKQGDSGTAIYSSGGYFKGNNIFINGSWMQGIVLKDSDGSEIKNLKTIGSSPLISSIRYLGNYKNAGIEDVHIANGKNGILFEGKPANVTMRRITTIKNDYCLKVNPSSGNFASNINVYDLNTQATKSSLWLKDIRNSTFDQSYLGLNGFDNPAFEGALTICGNKTDSLVVKGVRIQNNNPESPLVRGVVVKGGVDIQLKGVSLRKVNEGVVVNATPRNVIIDGILFLSDVDTNYRVADWSQVNVISYTSFE